MRPIPLKNPDVRLAPPRGWDDEAHGECETLEALDQNGVVYSFWKPEPEELEALNRGAPVRLGVHSRAHPAVSIGVIDDQDPDYPSLLAGFDEEKGSD
jgi:hypothetical protein